MLHPSSTTADETDLDLETKTLNDVERNDHNIKKTSSSIKISYSALNETDIKPTYEELHQTVKNFKASF